MDKTTSKRKGEKPDGRPSWFPLESTLHLARPLQGRNETVEDLDIHDTPVSTDPQNHIIKTQTASSQIKPPSSVREAVFVFSVCMAQWIALNGLSISVVTGHIIGKSFNTTNPGELSWYAAAYSLTVGTFILVSGRLGDLYGHKLLFLIGFCWFGLWSLLGGFAVWAHPVFFDCCRALQGIGAGLLLPNAIAIFGRTYPPGRRKEMVFSLFAATTPAGFIGGGAMAALISERLWWPWSYWLMGIACFLFALLGLLAIPNTPSSRKDDDLSTCARIDVSGAITGISGLVLVNFAFNQAPVVGWSASYTYILLIMGFLLLALFAIVERRAASPLLPTAIITGDVAWVLGCIAAGWSSFGILIYYWYQFMEVIKGDTPLLAVGKWAAAPITGTIASLLTGFLLSRVPPSFIMFCAMAAFTASNALLATTPVNQTYWAQAFVISLIAPFGMDMSFPSATVILSNAMPHAHQGLAASLVVTVVNYSISIGLGLAGTVESQVNSGGSDVLQGYRGALYLGTGLSGLGLGISILYGLVSWKAQVFTEEERCK